MIIAQVVGRRKFVAQHPARRKDYHMALGDVAEIVIRRDQQHAGNALWMSAGKIRGDAGAERFPDNKERPTAIVFQ